MLAAATLRPHAAAAADPAKVVDTYANIAHAMYEDSLIAAETLKAAVDNLVANPSRASLLRARAAWVAARQPYQQTEGFRFGNAAVDDWEGKVNAWPLDEGLIDYVDASYGKESQDNPLYTANVIANTKLRLGGKTVDATKITPELISGKLHEAGGVEANVASGYHAIEFLLWGQDLNGTGPGAGNRPHTDFDPKNCTHGNCDRRAQYLTAATDLLISDLKEIVAQWAPGGDARKAVTADPAKGVGAIVTGLGSLSYGELAGERIKLGLMLHDPEEEHDCFADNTHNSHYYDQVGMMSIYAGRYARIDGSVVQGESLADLIKAKDAKVAAKIDTAMGATLASMQVMKDTADRRVMAYDQMIGEGNAKGGKIIQDVVDGLVAQAKAIEGSMAPLGISGVAFEGSDSLDNPSAVFK
jgi:putative iron-regulated protein